MQGRAGRARRPLAAAARRDGHRPGSPGSRQEPLPGGHDPRHRSKARIQGSDPRHRPKAPIQGTDPSTDRQALRGPCTICGLREGLNKGTVRIPHEHQHYISSTLAFHFEWTVLMCYNIRFSLRHPENISVILITIIFGCFFRSIYGLLRDTGKDLAISVLSFWF